MIFSAAIQSRIVSVETPAYTAASGTDSHCFTIARVENKERAASDDKWKKELMEREQKVWSSGQLNYAV